MVIGPAEEFWRLRLVRMDPSDDLDFEWHDDILWREPDVRLQPGEPAFAIEAVSVAPGPEQIVRLAVFGDEDHAREFLEDVHDDLIYLTRSQFEEARFPAAE